MDRAADRITKAFEVEGIGPVTVSAEFETVRGNLRMGELAVVDIPPMFEFNVKQGRHVVLRRPFTFDDGEMLRRRLGQELKKVTGIK
jgi:hypothetical protein